MRQVRWASVTVGIAMLAVCGARPGVADVRSDQAAAIVQWPDVESWESGAGTVEDTIIQLSNTSAEPVWAWCFYTNANAHCTNNGSICSDGSDCCDSGVCGICYPGWNETDFRVHITPRQPVGWLASEGAAGTDCVPPKGFGTFALSGVGQCIGPDGSSNAGSRVPPVPESEFLGSLRCIAVDEDGLPSDRNVLKGESTFVREISAAVGDEATEILVDKHNAIGVQAKAGKVNKDNVLCLGGGVTDVCPDGAEYNGCPGILILDHFFDFAQNPVTGTPVETALVLVPCSDNYLYQDGGAAVVQYLVFNEYEQRFSTSRPFDCYQYIGISSIDTTQPTRSIFSAGVAGTLTGQTRIQGVNPLGDGGILGVAVEAHAMTDSEPFDSADFASFNIQHSGSRDLGDHIVLP